MNIQLALATVAIITFLGVVFYVINSVDDKPTQKKV